MQKLPRGEEVVLSNLFLRIAAWLESVEFRVRLAADRWNPDVAQDIGIKVEPAMPRGIQRGDVVWLDGRSLEVVGVDDGVAYVRDPRPFGYFGAVPADSLVARRDRFVAASLWEIA